MINVNNVSKSFVVKNGLFSKKSISAIQNINFFADDHTITGLLGANGAGKSTTMRILSTLIKADTGSVLIDGICVASQAQAVRSTIGYMPHNSGVYVRLTARENIAYYAAVSGMTKKQGHYRVDELLELLDMSSIADRRCEGFSQGQRTKVALARALVHKPKTLILDEPTNGLDVLAIRNLRVILKTLRDEGHCILLSSHVMQEVAALCDSIVIIHDGRVALSDTISIIQQQAQSDDLEDVFVNAISQQEHMRLEAEK